MAAADQQEQQNPRQKNEETSDPVPGHRTGRKGAHRIAKMPPRRMRQVRSDHCFGVEAGLNRVTRTVYLPGSPKISVGDIEYRFLQISAR